MLRNVQQIHRVIKDDNWNQPWLLLESLNLWMVTLETSIISIIKFSRIELYSPLLNDAIPCHYYIPNFKLLASSTRTFTTTPPINLNFRNVNHFKLLQHTKFSDLNLKCQPSLLFNSPAVRISSIDFRHVSPNSDDIIHWFNVYFVFSWGLTSYKFTKTCKMQIYFV